MSENTMKKQALLIGINQYAVLPELKFARQDAEAVADALEQNYCFSDDEVMLLTDTKPGLFKPLNKHIILNHLEKLANQDLDLFIFGFWGHGLFRNGERYLCPLDVMTEAVEDLGLPFEKLQEALANIRAKNTCLILDCCQTVHDRGEVELLTDGDENILSTLPRDIGLKRKAIQPEFESNFAILNSCKQGQSAYEWDSRQHGIFTAHLLDAMNHRFDSVTKIVSYLGSHVTQTAMELGKTQTPFYKLDGDIPLPVDTKTEPIVTGEVFISYRHANADLVAPIEKELQQQGISYFIDHAGVNYGMDYSEAISRALKACKVLLFIWTKDANNSPDILREVTMAFGLKKTVLPYKIGTFDVTEHDSLFYQLAPVSRYEVPEQTDATIKELVQRLQLALNGTQATKPIFVLPEQSKDAIIQKPEIGDIVVNVTPEQVEQKKIQFEQIQLPPLPEELIKIQSENKGLQTAIEQLQNFTHESLQQANTAVEQAQSQLDAWAERKERLWKDIPQELRNNLENILNKNPDCTEQSIENLLPDNMTNQQYFELIEQFQCGKKYEQASCELARVQKERQDKCNDAIVQLKQQLTENKKRRGDIKAKFLNTVLMVILSSCSNYDKLDTTFPEDELLVPLQQLDKYGLGWNAREMFSHARELWSNNRPCILAKHKAEIATQKRKDIFLGIMLTLWGVLSVIILSADTPWGYIFKPILCTLEHFFTYLNGIGIPEFLLRLVGGMIFLGSIPGLVFGWCGLLILFRILVPGNSDEIHRPKAGNHMTRKAGTRMTRTVNGIEFAFRWCPAGTFMMGTPETEKGYNAIEKQHQVTLTKGFWIMETQVTQKQWKAVMGTNPSYFKGDDLPVECVSWNYCQKFCKKCTELGLPVCLPTEAQWEYACRAGTTGLYAGDLDEMAWYRNNSGQKTHPVGTKKPNAWGLYDMHGNVWEWCEDWWDEYPSGSVIDPIGPTTKPANSSGRVFRGGNWNYVAFFCESSFRNAGARGHNVSILGVRVVLKEQ